MLKTNNLKDQDIWRWISRCWLGTGVKCKKKKATTYGVGYQSAGSGQVQTYDLFLPYNIKNAFN